MQSWLKRWGEGLLAALDQISLVDGAAGNGEQQRRGPKKETGSHRMYHIFVQRSYFLRKNQKLPGAETDKICRISQLGFVNS